MKGHQFNIFNTFKWLLNYIEDIYYIVGILGIITIIIAVCNYHNSIKHEKFDTSMKVIKTFQYKILPKLIRGHKLYHHNKQMEEYIYTNYYYHVYLRWYQRHHKLIPPKSRVRDFVIHRYNKEISYQANVDSYLNTVNNLEELSIYIEKGMVIKTLVFREIGNEFLKYYILARDVINIPDNYYSLMSCRKIASKWIHYQTLLQIRNDVFNYIERKI